MGWNTQKIKVLNIWGMELVNGMTFKSLEKGEPITIFNVYGPYLNNIPSWDNLFNNSLLGVKMVIVRGDLNFSLRQVEVWGPHACPDLLTEYFTHKLVERNWLDIEPCKLKPTWTNNRCGDGCVAK